MMIPKKINLTNQYAFLILLMCFTIGPLLLLMINALKTPHDFMVNPFGLPAKLNFTNFSEAWIKGKYALAYKNSVIVGISVIAVINLFGGACAYALAKMKFKGSNILVIYFILAMSIPVGLFLVPIFFLWQRLDLMNTLLGLIIIYSGIYMPFNIFFLRAFFMGIPDSLLESARLDGCSEFGTFMRLIIPIAKPAFLTVSLMVMLWTWNEFFFANAFIVTDKLKTVSTRYLTFTGLFTSNWSMISAAGAVAIIPITIFYLLFQRNFIEGLTAGSVKG